MRCATCLDVIDNMKKALEALKNSNVELYNKLIAKEYYNKYLNM